MPAYLDHAAGAPLDPVALEAMGPWLTGSFGNPSGAHRHARAARAAIDEARDTVAACVGVSPGDVVFTSGGTEADNLAVMGSASGRGGAVVVSAVEHPAVVRAAEASGCEVRTAPVGWDGRVDRDALRLLLGPDVSVVSIQLANHETGVVQDLEAIAALVRRRAPGAVLHTDAVAAAPWMDLTRECPSADLISLSGHKLGGPQGSGALALRRSPPLRPLMHGGGQERELRSGTQNVAAIVGMASALAERVRCRAEEAIATAARRNRLQESVTSGLPGCRVTALEARRLPSHLHLRFEGVESEALLVLLDEEGVSASAGAACASGAMEPSPVLMAMGLDKADALSSLRLTLGPSTTDDEIADAATAVRSCVGRLRRVLP